jgi:two-component system phosphate regulon sensor histidine kinase PhoR
LKLSLQWKWFTALAALLAALLLVVNIFINFQLPPYLMRHIQTDLERNALLAREIFSAKLSTSPPPVEEINQLTRQLSRDTKLRITVIAPDGTVLGESSDKPLPQIENHGKRPEIVAAKEKGIGVATRHSDTVNADMLYVAVRVEGAASTPSVGFVRVARPLDQIAQITAHVRRTVAFASAVVGLIAMYFLFFMARRITRPVQEMSEAAGRVARGDFSQRITAPPTAELAALATALNDMSRQLESRLGELRAEKAELSAVLAGMTEGVLVVDAAGKIRLVNEALRRQFEIDDEAIGKTVLEVFRHVALQELVAETAQRGENAERELVFLSPSAERTFQLRAASLHSREGAEEGVVVVFHDISRIKKLETMRKEFVANVSHELRTPLSIIKGYVETLLDPQPPDAETAKQFLQTVQRHSLRLEALIGDLLTISSLESQQARLEFQSVSLRSIAQGAAEELAGRAKEKNIAVAVEIPADLPNARADAQRLHQVFFNLLDNAVKYTPSSGRVAISARATNGEIEVCVADNGPGIAAEHLPHVFERFYRVDKARSREMGGTGLGLSIVKHIVQAHGGKVWAESELEKGSRFYFTVMRML